MFECWLHEAVPNPAEKVKRELICLENRK